MLDSFDRADLRGCLVPGALRIAHASLITERTSEAPKLRVGARVRELWAYREILLNLVRKELKVKYTASVLGAVWSVLNPIVFLAVFTFVVKMLGNQTPHYPVFLLSGLLAWNLFSVALGNGTRSVIDNGNLVKKVYFPREILPARGRGSGPGRLRAAVGRAAGLHDRHAATGSTPRRWCSTRCRSSRWWCSRPPWCCGSPP